MTNSLPFIDPQDASEGVKTFSEGVNLFSNQNPVFNFCLNVTVLKSVFIMPDLSYNYIFTHQVGVPCSFSVCIFVHVLSFHSLSYD